MGPFTRFARGSQAGNSTRRSTNTTTFLSRRSSRTSYAFFDALRDWNKNAKIILTVSPVPLAATASGRHVLEATTYSKSVLRVACSEAAAQRPDVVYFPAYEIITGAFSRGSYFAADLRTVTEAGIDHVMNAFLRHFADKPASADLKTSLEPAASHVTDSCACLFRFLFLKSICSASCGEL